ncbi:MAG: PH domain-containing protein [Terriglobia bacterium]
MQREAQPYNSSNGGKVKLRAGETLVYKTRPHWIVFGWAVWLASFAARFFYAASSARNADDAQMWLNLAWTFGVFAAIAAILAQFYRWISRFILTDRRVVLKNGIFRQRSTEFLLPSVESVLVEFPILGRLFNYGTLTVRGFGGSRDSIKRVPKPERVRELIEDRQSLDRGVVRAWRRATAT